MTILAVCAVRDSALEAFMQPIFVPAPAVAVRSFIQEAKRPESPVSQSPSDYELYHLAEYNDATGTFSNLDSPVRLMRAKDIPAS